jgi:hypothetical protein
MSIGYYGLSDIYGNIAGVVPRGGWKPIPLKSIKRPGQDPTVIPFINYGIQSPVTALQVGASFASHDQVTLVN